MDLPLRHPEQAPLVRGQHDAFAAAFRSIRTAIIMTDPTLPDNPIVFANDAFLQLTGYASHDVVGRNCRFLQGPETSAETVEHLRRGVAARGDVSAVILNYRQDGTTFWNAVSITPVLDDIGAVALFVGTLADVTAARERQRADRQAEQDLTARNRELENALDVQHLLVAEIDHRTKNNLQMVSAMLTLQTMSIPDPELRRTLQEMLERVDALGLVHKRLYELSQRTRFDLADFIHELLDTILGASGRRDIVVDQRLNAVVIGADQAAAVALILNEVLTNAIKHGFPSGRHGSLTVVLAAKGDRCLITIADDGVGLPTEKAVGPTFGTTLVETLARHLHAAIAWTRAQPGTVFTLDFPIKVAASP
ncbi:PAS domain-containing protein [Lichenihabitans sp. PAMC28606]|uniref:sensor histidine kinase n=1 Tax=Lichenihabitans sp. PAMC28606 TaxID=2880932 RepID=UPI001D0ACEA5|nr:histidine kinase dimerization/phosphoacceptor domain -containing protein [Lichenihabitans sp. PAMC28606]UDL93165.1 PAS domain-containing protein [Lichenihabitans sp. PAMC28606]